MVGDGHLIKVIMKIKKREFKKIISEKKSDVTELVDDNRLIIKGDEPKSGNNDEIRTAPHQTSDDFQKATTQPRKYPYGYVSSPRYGTSPNDNINTENKDSLDDKFKEKIKNVVNKLSETILSKEEKMDKDFVKKKENVDDVQSTSVKLNTIMKAIERARLNSKEKQMLLKKISGNG